MDVCATAELDRLEYVIELAPNVALKVRVPLLRIEGTCWNPVSLSDRFCCESGASGGEARHDAY